MNNPRPEPMQMIKEYEKAQSDVRQGDNNTNNYYGLKSI
jgi:hypothetical protein